jgi:hypothetical protein
MARRRRVVSSPLSVSSLARAGAATRLSIPLDLSFPPPSCSSGVAVIESLRLGMPDGGPPEPGRDVMTGEETPGCGDMERSKAPPTSVFDPEPIVTSRCLELERTLEATGKGEGAASGGVACARCDGYVIGSSESMSGVAMLGGAVSGKGEREGASSWTGFGDREDDREGGRRWLMFRPAFACLSCSAL